MESADHIRELSNSNGKRPAPFLKDALFQSELYLEWKEDIRLMGSYNKRRCHGISMVTQDPSSKPYKGAQESHSKPLSATMCVRCLSGEPGHINHMMVTWWVTWCPLFISWGRKRVISLINKTSVLHSTSHLVQNYISYVYVAANRINQLSTLELKLEQNMAFELDFSGYVTCKHFNIIHRRTWDQMQIYKHI